MMKLLVISSAPIIVTDSEYQAYSPYVKEMELWAKHADTIQFCCPIWKEDKKLLVSKIPFSIEKTIELNEFDIKSILNVFKSLPKLVYNLRLLYLAIYQADHIHLRCPGNIGLLAAIVQILFPSKIKTAKYAGNWDSNSKQPWSYKLQKWILSNTFLTKNMQVLVYGEWQNQTKNIKPFFTATYTESEKEPISIKKLNDTIKIIFVGTLSTGKKPLYAIEIIEKLLKNNINVNLTIYGEGNQREQIEKYIVDNNLQTNIILKGNQSAQTIKKAYQDNHFVILPSKSEGWPKVVAEAMFWACVPISSKVSCVPFMLDNGNRGVLLDFNLENDTNQLLNLIKNQSRYAEMQVNGANWSRKYTLDYFEQEIKLLLQP